MSDNTFSYGKIYNIEGAPPNIKPPEYVSSFKRPVRESTQEDRERTRKEFEIINKLREYGVDYNLHEENCPYDECRYIDCVIKASNCLEEDKEIPKDVAEYLLEVKRIREEYGVI